MNQYITKFLASTWVWAIIPSGFVYFLIPEIGSPYMFSIEKGLIGPGDHVYFYDLNDDGTTEQIHAKASVPLNNLPVMTNEGKYYDQWNLADSFVSEISELIFGDYDVDGLSEIYVFSMHKDSLFLNASEAFDSLGFHLTRKFIATVNLVKGQNNSVIKPIGFFDNDNDGFKEFYFAITTGFGLRPRNCYFINLKTLELTTSKSFGVNFNSPSFAYLDNDSVPEIITSTTSPGNQKTPELLSDKSAWLIVLNAQLNLVFPPHEFDGFGGRIDVEALKGDEGNNLLTVYNYNGKSKSHLQPGMRLYSPSGKLITEKTFSSLEVPEGKSIVVTTRNRDELTLLSDPALIFDSGLRSIKAVPIPLSSDFTYKLINLEDDERMEVVLYSKAERKLFLCTHDLQVMSTAEIDLPESEWELAIAKNLSKLYKIYIRSGERQWHLTLSPNNKYFFRYLIYPAIYLSFFGLIFLTRTLSTHQVEKREALKKRLLELQLQSIKSQLDPHFTFNALNSISSLLYIDDRKTAYDGLNIFTRLLRQLLNDADKVYRPLEEEINFVTNYLELEKIRFSGFEYEIIISENISGTELVPKMALQLFAENSVKHGLVPRGAGGCLVIKAHKTDHALVLCVEDNGVGRKQSARLNPQHGKGIKINNDFYTTLRQLTGKAIHSKITDLYDDVGNARGTKVEVRIPLDITIIIA